MTGPEMIHEVERRDYYRERERKNAELVDCTWYAIKLGVVIAGLLSIAGHVRELWDALASCF